MSKLTSGLPKPNPKIMKDPFLYHAIYMFTIQDTAQSLNLIEQSIAVATFFRKGERWDVECRIRLSYL